VSYRDDNGDDDHDDDDDTAEKESSSWRTLSFSDISARIGELPQAARNRKIPWPWMDINRKKKEKKEAAAAAQVEEDNTMNDEVKTTTDSIPSSNSSNKSTNSPSEEKTDLCIGSIFGLDVGGTLAKLVYFEERPLSRHAIGGSPFSSSAPRSIRRSTANLAGMAHSKKPASTSHITIDHEKNEIHKPNLLSQKSMSAKEISRAGSLRVPSPHHRPTETGETATIGPNSLAEANQNLQQQAQLRYTRSHDGETSHSNSNNNSNDHNSTTELQQDLPGRVRRIQSNMDFLTQREHRAQALDRFYAFARENLSNNPIPANANSTTTATKPEADKKAASTTDGDKSDDAPKEASGQANANQQQQNSNNNELVRDDNLSFDCLDGTFHFLYFESRYMQYAINLMRRYELHQTIHTLGATGGGAHKFGEVFKEELGINMEKVDELESLVAGMQFVLQTVVGECYTYRPPPEQSSEQSRKIRKRGSSSSLNNHYGNYVGVEQENWSSLDENDESPSATDSRTPGESKEHDEKQKGQYAKSPSSSSFSKDDSTKDSAAAPPKPGNRLDEWWWSRKVPRDAISDAETYPYLLVTIGTGVSILRVDGPRKHERISGSTIGGGTYWGLIRLLTSVENFSNVIELAEKGDPSKVDMMVGDIYGSNSEALEKLGLREDLVASSFGKLVAKEDPAEGLKEEDLARALLLMVTNNIGQVAYLNAQLHKTSRIYFVGNFLRQNKLSQRRLSFAIDFWSKGKMEALFLEHEGYFGALGAFLMSQDFSSYPAQLQQFQQQQNNSHSRHFSAQQSMPAEYSSCDDEDAADDLDSSHNSSIAAALAAFKRRSFTSIDGT